MSDEEVVREGLEDLDAPYLAAFEAILSDRDSLRADLERANEQIRRDHDDYSGLYDSLERVKAERDSLRATARENKWYAERRDEMLTQAEADRDSLRAALKQWAAASAERVQMDGETIASLRAALEEIMRRADAFSGAGLSKVAPISIIAHAALQEAE